MGLAERYAPRKHKLIPRMDHVRLLEIRELMGLNQQQMAELLGYSVWGYANIETAVVPVPAKLRLNMREKLPDLIDARIAALQQVKEQIANGQI